MVAGKEQGSLIVFKHAGLDGRLEVDVEVEGVEELKEEALQGEEVLEGEGKGAVLGLKGTKGDVCLELGLPKHRAAGKEDNVSCARLGRGGIVRLLDTMERAEVGVDVQVEVELELFGAENGTLITRTHEVANDSFDGFGVGRLNPQLFDHGPNNYLVTIQIIICHIKCVLCTTCYLIIDHAI